MFVFESKDQIDRPKWVVISSGPTYFINMHVHAQIYDCGSKPFSSYLANATTVTLEPFDGQKCFVD